MTDQPRLALLEAAHESDRDLASLARVHTECHNAFVTNIRKIRKQVRSILNTLNSPPFLKDKTDADLVQQPPR